MVNNNIEKVVFALRYIKMFRDSFCRVPRRGNSKQTEVDLPKATMFSDSIVISKEVDEYFSFSDFIESIAQLQFNLLKEGILLRGGVDIGPIYHDESFIFGSGMISAYLLESNVSRYPRITISNNAIEKIQLWDEKKFENKFKEYVWYGNEKVFLMPKNLEEDFNNDELAYTKRDLEGITYIDYMRVGCQMIQASKEDVFIMDEYIFMDAGINSNYKEDMLAIEECICIGFIESILSKIQKLIKNGMKDKDIKVREKYEWLREYFNNTIKQIIKTYENRIIDNHKENEKIEKILATLLIV